MVAQTPTREDTRFLSSAERGFQVLEVLSSASGPLSLTELSKGSGLTIPTLQRLTATLIQSGYLEKDTPTKRYRLTVKTVDLLYGFLSRNEFAKLAWPHLVRLREALELDVSLSVPMGRAMIYVHRLPGHWENFENTLPGRQLPMHLSASGRCYLASHSDAEVKEYLASAPLEKLTPWSLIDPDRIVAEIVVAREKGYSLVEQETSAGLITLACPVLHGTKIIAGLSVHAYAASMPAETLLERALSAGVSTAQAMRLD